MTIIVSAVGSAFLTLFGAPLLAGAVACALTFLFQWPRSRWEGWARFISTFCMAAIGGPFLVVALHSWWPGLFASARSVISLYGVDPALGIAFVAVPLMVMAGLPAWWLLGGLVRWLDRRKDKDLGEIVRDAADVVKEVRTKL